MAQCGGTRDGGEGQEGELLNRVSATRQGTEVRESYFFRSLGHDDMSDVEPNKSRLGQNS